MSENQPSEEWEEIREQFKERVIHLGSATEEAIKPPEDDEEPETQQLGQSKPEGRGNPTPDQSEQQEEPSVSLRETNEPRSIPKAPDIQPPLDETAYDSFERMEPHTPGRRIVSVFKGTLPDGQHFVVKKPSEEVTLNRDQHDQLLNQAKKWKRFGDADHVVTLLRSGRDKEYTPWVVMEYMDGGSLKERIGELSVEQALWTALCITHGVRSSHYARFTHGDLKPTNILFRSVEDAWDVPKITDWEHSRDIVRDDDGETWISKRYAAPEQLLEFEPELTKEVDVPQSQYEYADPRATDRYQLGLIFYELLTGRHPFEDDPSTAIKAKFNTDPTPPSQVVDAIPSVVDDPIMEALSPFPHERNHTTVHLLNDLARAYDAIVERDIDIGSVKLSGGTTWSESP